MIAELAAVCSQETDASDCPLAVEITGKIPIYDGDSIVAAPADDVRREWCRVIGEGPDGYRRALAFLAGKEES